MLLLSLDTTTTRASCAVARDGAVVSEAAIDDSRQLALQLPGVLRDVLDASGIQLSQIDSFAVAIGPGSFTGLRIGIATMQGLAFGVNKPLIGISGLTALHAAAAPMADGSRVATWVDAWRGDVYAAVFEPDQREPDPVVARPADVIENLTNDVLFVGDGAETYRDLIVSRLGSQARFARPTTPLLAGTIARLATIEYNNGRRPPPHAIRPLYVRRSDAELARDRK